MQVYLHQSSKITRYWEVPVLSQYCRNQGLAVRASDANAEVAIVLRSIPSTSDTVESEGRQMKQCWICTVHRKKIQKFPLFKNKLRFFLVLCLSMEGSVWIRIRTFILNSTSLGDLELGWTEPMVFNFYFDLFYKLTTQRLGSGSVPVIKKSFYCTCKQKACYFKHTVRNCALCIYFEFFSPHCIRLRFHLPT